MASSRRKFTPEEKASLVLEMLKEEKSVPQLASSTCQYLQPVES